MSVKATFEAMVEVDGREVAKAGIRLPKPKPSKPAPAGSAQPAGSEAALAGIAAFLQKLRDLKLYNRRALLKLLESEASWLASLPARYLEQLIQQARKESTAKECDIRKAVALGRDEMPPHIYWTETITLKTWEGLPKEARAALWNPRAKVWVKRKGRREEILVSALGSLSAGIVRQIISGNWPDRGIVDPDDDTPRAKEPAYFRIVRAVKEHGEVILTSSTDAGTTYRTKTTVKELQRILAALYKGGIWVR